MGLDMFIYANKEDRTKELVYFRKRPAIHGWMEHLFEEKGRPGWDGEEDPWHLGIFNGIPLELTLEDVEKLERDIKDYKLPYETRGFFFGEDEPNEEDKMEDLKVMAKIKRHLKRGWKIIYNSSW